MTARPDRLANLTATYSEPPEGTEFKTNEVLTIATGHFVHDIFTAFLPPLLPRIREKLAIDYAAIGGLNVFLLIPSLMQPFIGYAADKISMRYLVIVAPALTATMCGLLGVANSYVMMSLLLLVVGISTAVFHAPAPAMIGRISGNRVGTGMSFFMASGELGRTVGPLVLLLAIGWFELEGIWRTASLGWLASAFLYWRLHRVSARPAQRQGLSLRQMLPNARRVYPPLMWIMTTRAFLSIAMTTYLPIFMQDEMGYDFNYAAMSLVLLEGAGVVGALSMGTASDWFGRRRILAALFLAAPLLCFGFLNSSGWLLFAYLVPLGFVTISPQPVMLAVVQDSFSENRALANGIFLMANFVIRSPALWLLGGLADRFGLSTAFLISAVLALATAPAVYWLPKRQPEEAA